MVGGARVTAGRPSKWKVRAKHWRLSFQLRDEPDVRTAHKDMRVQGGKPAGVGTGEPRGGEARSLH